MPGHSRSKNGVASLAYVPGIQYPALPEDVDGRVKPGHDAEGASLLPVTIRALPAVLGNIEDDAVGVLELALEIAVTFVAEIEEEFAAVRLDALLGLDEIVDLEAEVMRADETFRDFSGPRPRCRRRWRN